MADTTIDAARFRPATSGSHRAPLAFVFGATGYTGRHVVDALAAQRIPVLAHVRPGSARADAMVPVFEARGARVDRTPWEENVLVETMRRERPTLVFALLGITRSGARAEARRTGATIDYDAIDYGLTRMVISATSRAGVRARMVYLSSAGVADNAPGAYLRARWKSEEALRNSNLPWTVVRPSFITGDDRDESRPMERVGAAVSTVGLRALRALGARRVHDRYAPITGEALGTELVRLALDPSAENRVIEAEELRRDARIVVPH